MFAYIETSGKAHMVTNGVMIYDTHGRCKHCKMYALFNDKVDICMSLPYSLHR